MKKQELKMLEKIYAAEINGALSGGCHLFQTKSKIADALTTEGYVRKRTMVLSFGGMFPVHIEGYELTELGRMAYCMTC